MFILLNTGNTLVIFIFSLSVLVGQKTRFTFFYAGGHFSLSFSHQWVCVSARVGNGVWVWAMMWGECSGPKGKSFQLRSQSEKWFIIDHEKRHTDHDEKTRFIELKFFYREKEELKTEVVNNWKTHVSYTTVCFCWVFSVPVDAGGETVGLYFMSWIAAWRCLSFFEA